MSALLPQLDFSTYGSQIFWLIVTFSILYFSLSKVFLPNIISLIKKRQSYIDDIYKKIEIEDGTISELENEKLTIINNTKNEINQITKSAKSKIDIINIENKNLIEKNLSAMQDELIAHLKTNIESEKEIKRKNSLEIFKNFTNLFSISSNDDLDQKLNSTFENKWSIETDKIIKKYNKG
jgi:F0F1-type ATP synthase membrane subunit b/b'